MGPTRPVCAPSLPPYRRGANGHAPLAALPIPPPAPYLRDNLRPAVIPGVSMTKQLHLGAFMRPVGIHTAWWRVPGAWPDANFNLAHLVSMIRRRSPPACDACAPSQSPHLPSGFS